MADSNLENVKYIIICIRAGWGFMLFFNLLSHRGLND